MLMSHRKRQETGDRRQEQEKNNGTGDGPLSRIRELENRVAELLEQNQALRSRADSADSAAGGAERTPLGRLLVAADELPVDYKGHMPRHLVVSLRPELRRRVMGLFAHLKDHHATIRHPRYHDEVRHVDDPSHVISWLLERVTLVGAQPEK